MEFVVENIKILLLADIPTMRPNTLFHIASIEVTLSIDQQSSIKQKESSFSHGVVVYSEAHKTFEMKNVQFI